MGLLFFKILIIRLLRLFACSFLEPYSLWFIPSAQYICTLTNFPFMNKFLSSSLGQKVVMACTGLFLCLFLVEHLYTNLLLYAGDGGVEFNEASHFMVHSIIIRIIEVVLGVSIVIHVWQAVQLTRQNAKARPVAYSVTKVSETSTWFSRNMGFTGSMILFFTIVHLYQFFVPYRLTGEIGVEGSETVAEEVAEALANPWYALLYLVSVAFLAFHLNHGFQSAFQSLGANNKNYAPMLKMFGSFFAYVIVGLGFASFPILFYLSHLAGFDLLNWNL